MPATQNVESRIEIVEKRIALLEHQLMAMVAAHNDSGETACANHTIIGVRKGNARLDMTSAEAQSVADTLELRVASWDHHWNCNIVHVCKTTFNGSAFVIDSTNGKVLTWNLIETAATDNCSIADNDKSNYQSFRNTDRCNFGWGTRNHRSVHVSARLQFYADWGSIAWLVQSNTCG